MLDFGLAPVRGDICRTLTVHNTGDGAVHCRWEINHPFSMSPDASSIEAGQSADFECRFQPPEASVYTVLVACHADTGYSATVKVCNRRAVHDRTCMFITKCLSALAAGWHDRCSNLCTTYLQQGL